MTDLTEMKEPTGTESLASFRISGTSLDLDAITRSLGIKPSRIHSPGDLDILGNPFRDFMWTLESPPERKEDLARHLEWLTTKLSPNYLYLRSLTKSADISIACNLRLCDTDQGGFSLEPKHFSLAIELGVRMDFYLLVI